MSTNKTNTQDPAKVALSAVEKALDEHDEAVNEAADMSQSEADKARFDAGAVPFAANDDLFASASERFQYRGTASYAPYFFYSLLFSLIWVGLVGSYGLSANMLTLSTLLDPVSLLSDGITAAFLGFMLLPIFMIFGLFIMMWRAKDMRLAAQSMTDVALKLAEPENMAIETISTVSQAIRREVTAISDGLDKAIERAGELEMTVQNEVVALEKSSQSNESRLRALITELSDERQVIITNAENVRSAISGSHELFVDDLNKIGDDIKAQIDGLSSQMNETISSSSENLSTTFNDMSTEYLERLDLTMEEKATNLNTILEDKSDILVRQLSDLSETIDSSLTEKSEEIGKDLLEKAENLDNQIGHRSTEIKEILSTHSGDLIDFLDNKTKVLEKNIDGQIVRMNEDLNLYSDTISRNIGSYQEFMASNLATQSDYLQTLLSTSKDEFASVLANQTDETFTTFINKVNQTTDTFNEQVDQTMTAYGNKIDTSSASLTSQINHAAQMLDEVGGRINLEVSERANDIAATLSDTTIKLDSMINIYSSDLVSKFDEATGIFVSTLETKSEQAGNDLRHAGSEVLDEFSSRVSHLAGEIDGKLQDLNNIIGDKGSQLSGHLESSTNTLEDKLDRISRTISVGTEAIDDILSERTMDIARAFTAGQGKVNESVASGLSQVGDALDYHAGQISSLISDRISSLNDVLNERISTIPEQLVDNVDTATERMQVVVRTSTEEISKSARAIEDLIEGQASVKAKEIAEQTIALDQNFNQKLEFLSDSIESKAVSMMAAIGSKTDDIRRSLDENALYAEELVERTTGRIQENINDALGRLNDSNLLLERVLETTSGNLATMEGNLLDNTHNLRESIDKALQDATGIGQSISEELKGLQEGMGHMVTQATQLTDNLKDKEEIFSQTLQSILVADEAMESKLTARRDSIEGLGHALAKRSQEVDGLLRGYANEVNELVAMAERRSQELSQMIVSTTDDTSHKVVKEFERVHGTALSESNKAKETLTNVQRQIMDELNELIRNATGRFTESASQMRQSAVDVQQELDNTRIQLKRTLIDLPEETKESAAAMRRVVAEQVGAIDELNAILRKQAGVLEQDFVGQNIPQSAPSLVQSIGGSEQPINVPHTTHITSGGVHGNLAYSSLPEPAPVFEAVDPEMVREENEVAATQTQLDDDKTVSEDDLIEAITSLEEKKSDSPQVPKINLNFSPQGDDLPKTAINQPQNQGSWVRDLLQNASDEGETVSQANNETELSSSMANAISNTALAEAWDKYNSGESQAFTRRLYTLPGQTTYDEVRRRFKRDEAFKTSAMNYIQEFEAVLDKVAKEPNGVVRTRAYLLSDSGKVYTLLAHVSGRLN